MRESLFEKQDQEAVFSREQVEAVSRYREQEGSLVKEARRWLTRGILALPLVVGCSPERAIKDWVQHKPREHQRSEATQFDAAPAAIIETENGQRISFKIKESMNDVFDQAPRATIIEPAS